MKKIRTRQIEKRSLLLCNKQFGKHSISSLRATKKRTRQVIEKRIRAFSGAPRSTIINCRLCQQAPPFRIPQGKAFCSRKMAPTLESSSINEVQHKKRDTPLRISFFVAQRRGFEPPVGFRPTHDFQSCSLNHSDISAYFLLFLKSAYLYYCIFRKNASVFITLSKKSSKK